MPVWIPWLKQNQQIKGVTSAVSPAAPGAGSGKTWAPIWPSAGNQKGGAGQKGSGGGGWKGGRAQRKPPQAVPESFAVSPDQRFMGIVRSYKKWSGFGFLELQQKGLVPEDQLYVNWRDLQTEDRFPQLVPEMEVELSIMKVKDRASGGWTLRAKAVSLAGGQPIAVQDELDAQHMQFVGGQHLRYTGTLQFFSPKRGFGWLNMDDGYALPEPVPRDLRVDLPEVNAAGKQPPGMKDVAVEFGIMKTKRGQFKAYNMTLPGGIPMTQEGLEHRIVLGTRTFQGTVEIFNWRYGWGFIKGAPGAAFPPNVVGKLKQMQEEAAKRGKAQSSAEPMLYFRRDDINPGVQVDKGQQVTFKVYTDDKGAGACEIR